MAQTVSATGSLRSRALFLLLTAAAIAGVAALLAFKIVFGPAADREVEKRGQAMVRTLAEHQGLRLALSLKDKNGARTVADDVRRGDDDVRAVILLDAQDHVLAESTAESLVPPSADALKGLASSGSLQQGEVFYEGQAVEHSGTKQPAAGGGLDFAADDAAPQAATSTLGRVVIGISSAATRSRMQAQTVIAIGTTALLLALAFMVFFGRISDRLHRVVTFAEQVGSGDLGAALSPDGEDEIGRLLGAVGEMTGRMSTLVSRLQDASRALTVASGEILSSSTAQSQSASRQASSVAETGATVAQLRETFAQTAERAQAVIDLAKKSEDSSSNGRVAVQESVAAMEQLRDQVLAISRTILGLVERTAQIGTIIDTVNDLAEQSNVLALNAAIEAAKAGEHGRGFAVVAREVRNLAERSKDSTSQVRTILDDVEKATREAMTAIDEGTRKAQVGMELATRAGQSIANLGSAIDESSGAAKQIAASLRQQSVGVEQIWEAMREIDRAVKTNVEGIEQLGNASRNMKDVSEQVGALVSGYKITARA